MIKVGVSSITIRIRYHCSEEQLTKRNYHDASHLRQPQGRDQVVEALGFHLQWFAWPPRQPKILQILLANIQFGMPLEGEAFFKNAPALCNADCDREVKRLLRKWRSCLIYGFKQPRMDPATPWDMTHSKWAGTTFSVSWDEDTDPVVDGGHK
jgi:hypothetical protein